MTTGTVVLILVILFIVKFGKKLNPLVDSLLDKAQRRLDKED